MKLRAIHAVGFLAVLAALPIAGALERANKPKVELVGTAAVVDGDTLDMGGVRIRLYGIDAPEHGQTCTYPNNVVWTCGVAATLQLHNLVAQQTLNCHRRDTDRYGRIVAVCYAGDTDLGAAMVRAGMAVAYRRYSDAYVPDENAARLTRKGMWAGTFQQPEDFRRARR
jgi:endonuclease YncB( thermonuclease family)